MTVARPSVQPERATLGLCPGCSGGAPPEPFLDIGPVPVNCSAFTATAAEAQRADTGSIRLAACPTCGYIHNTSFDPDVITYDSGYDNSLDHSQVFRDYERQLVDELDRRWPLRKGTVLEIGCGSGHFLAELCDQAGSQGIGFDPSWPGGAVDGPISIVAAPYTGAEGIRARDLVCCRHVLEHLVDPLGFLDTIQSSMDPGCGLYIEVPSAEHIFGSSDVWDLIYPHLSYFSAPSLGRLVRRAGLEVLEIDRRFGGEFLALHGRKGRPGAGGSGDRSALQDLLLDTRRFARRLSERMAESARALAAAAGEGRTVALWGAGARAVTFLNLVPGADRIPVVVDVNPAKAGRHVPGTGQKVVPPDDPAVAEVDTVMVMNAVYATEIGERLRLAGSSADLVLA